MLDVCARSFDGPSGRTAGAYLLTVIPAAAIAESRDPAAAVERLGPGSSRLSPLVRDDGLGWPYSNRRSPSLTVSVPAGSGPGSTPPSLHAIQAAASGNTCT